MNTRDKSSLGHNVNGLRQNIVDLCIKAENEGKPPPENEKFAEFFLFFISAFL